VLSLSETPLRVSARSVEKKKKDNGGYIVAMYKSKKAENKRKKSRKLVQERSHMCKKGT
jgi:hypothetical protein